MWNCVSKPHSAHQKYQAVEQQTKEFVTIHRGGDVVSNDACTLLMPANERIFLIITLGRVSFVDEIN
jgi:hypothetical protein